MLALCWQMVGKNGWAIGGPMSKVTLGQSWQWTLVMLGQCWSNVCGFAG